jgi:hypothetical protein
MSKEAATLTSKLHERSDAKLRARLRDVFSKVRPEFTDGSSKTIIVGGGYVSGDGNNMDKEFKVDAQKALIALEQLSFDMQRDNCRKVEVDNFMSQVENLSNQVGELQDQLR